MDKKPFFIIITIFALIPATSFAEDTYYDEFSEFETWADSHGISLVGVSKNSLDLYYHGYDETADYVNWKTVPGVLDVADSLYKIPNEVISVMDGKTIYFSTEYGRSYSVLGSFPEYDILVGVDRGIIIEQNISSYTVIHEIGHIVDFHGIRGMYGDSQNHFNDSLELRDSIFAVKIDYQIDSSELPLGHVSAYSTANDAENFAENFAHYVERPEVFREMINDDPQLAGNYDFIKNEIFQNLEY